MMNGNGGFRGIVNKVAAALATAAILGLAAFATSHASDEDLKEAKATHKADVEALRARDRAANAALQEIRETTARLDERSKADSRKLDMVLDKL